MQTQHHNCSGPRHCNRCDAPQGDIVTLNGAERVCGACIDLMGNLLAVAARVAVDMTPSIECHIGSGSACHRPRGTSCFTPAPLPPAGEGFQARKPASGISINHIDKHTSKQPRESEHRKKSKQEIA